MTPEQQARINIDNRLEQAGWAVQDVGSVNLYAGAGVAAVAMEAGASVMVGHRRSGALGLLPSIEWTESGSLVESWDEGVTIGQLRRWARPLVLASPPVARFVSANLGWRRSPRLLVRGVAEMVSASRVGSRNKRGQAVARPHFVP